MFTIPARVITVSDRCSSGKAVDQSGPLAQTLLMKYGAIVDTVEIVPDGIESVRSALKAAITANKRLIMTTGGTGISPRDFTPEATAELLVAKLDGLAEQIRTRGGKIVPAAGLSRGLVGITSRELDAALVVNAPGSTNGVQDTIETIGPLLSHIFAQLTGKDH